MVRNYNTIMFFLVAGLISLFFVIKTLNSSIFITQLIFFVILLIFSSITLFSISKNYTTGWPFSVFLFSLHLMNAVYLFFFKLNLSLVIYSVIVLLGFIISVYVIDEKARKRISTRIKVLKKPKKIKLKKVSSSNAEKTIKKQTKKKIKKVKTNKVK
jgi:hypothetical protein